MLSAPRPVYALADSTTCATRTRAHLLTAKEPLPVVAVAARLGHSSLVVTLNVYAHVMPSSDKDADSEALAEGTPLAVRLQNRL